MFNPSPVESMQFANKTLFIKRDDLLDSQFSGNKARKFYHFLHNDFNHISKVISSGSSQSNSMYSLAVLANRRGWQFDYYVSHLSDTAKQSQVGNYAQAISLGANIIDVSSLVNASPFQSKHLDETLTEMELINDKPNILYIPEGGRCEYAESGLAILAQEIIDWAILNEKNDVCVFLPSGTGTTAVYLNKWLMNLCLPDQNIKVITCSVVGGDDYLKQQFKMLCDEQYHPQIVTDGKKYHFGKLTKQNYDMWKYICAESKIEFELLYDPIGFQVLQHYICQQTNCKADFLYLHQGGLLGNQTMLPRYQRKYDK